MALSDVNEVRERFEKLFRETDTDGSGYLSLEEFSTLLSRSGYQFTPLQVKQQFNALDIDGDNTVSMDEFIQAMTGIPLVDHRRAMWRKAFIAWDADQSGTVNRAELRQVFIDVIGRELADDELEKVFRRLDADNDGEINWCEFADYFAGLTKHFL